MSDIHNMPTYKFVAQKNYCTIGTMKTVYRSDQYRSNKRQYFNAFKYHIRTFPIHMVNV